MSRTQPLVDTADTDEQLSQFDFLLAAIPLSLLAGIGSVLLFSVPQVVGVTVGAGIAASLIGYSVYAVAQVTSSSDSREPRLHERTNHAE